MHCVRHQELWDLIKTDIDAVDLAHDHLHVKRVYQWAIRIAQESQLNADLCGAAALLHDLVNIPKESIYRPLGSELSAVKGAELLPIAGYSEAESQQIIEGIRTCSWSKGQAATNNIGRVLQDADRLDAIGAIGIARNIACAQAMSSRGNPGQLYNQTDPFGKTDRPQNDKRYAIDHFAIKLLRLGKTMNTDYAKKEAARRHKFLLTFLSELEQDLL
jgi:uncharacterized protein